MFHFATPRGWLNDPNGLIYLDGEYHLFYQHYPDDITWGPMHWGHAVSSDMLCWQNLPVALAPDSHGAIFSGSVVIDHANTAGFGAGAMVAIFTYARESAQSQGLAYSYDRGRSWTKYLGNPVLLAPPDTPDFRDPRVFWYSQGDAGHWVMLLAVGRAIWIYTAPDLKTWTRRDVFGGRGAVAGIWECPDLVELPVDGGPQTHWALLVSVTEGGPAGGGGQQYFVGSFDGTRFTPEPGADVVRWADYGADFYAAQSWNTPPDARCVWLGWLNNWTYARQTPASTWRGAMSFPRELALASAAGGLQLIQRPAAELASLRSPLGRWNDLVLAPGENPLAEITGDALELLACFAVGPTTAARRFGLRVRVGVGEQTTVVYDVERGLLMVERDHVGQLPSHFATPQVIALSPRTGLITLHLLLDHCALELFADGGRAVFTNQIFPSPDSQGLELFAEGGPAQLVALEAYRLRYPHVMG